MSAPAIPGPGPAAPAPRALPAGHKPAAGGHAAAGASTAATPSAGSRSDAIAAMVILGVVAMLILPIPPLLLDLLLAVSLAIGVAVLMTAVYMERPLEFSSFPAILLVVTLFRLTLNVASTRLILLRGHEGPDAVSAVIKAFGAFVAGGDLVVGLVLFLILLIINFIVITKGAGRIAEVAARFTLDALPGKQMSIDADLNAGIIGEAEAKQRRREVEREADFFGAMDGASKFVRGDAVAALIITAINLVGGLAIGTIEHGLGIGDALSTYAILTMGDGLVSQLPALVISTAAGVVVSRASGNGRLGGEVGAQMLTNPKPLFLTSGLVGALAVIPGLPALPLMVLAGAIFAVARQAKKKREQQAAAPAPGATTPDGKAKKKSDEETPVEELLQVETLELTVGYALVGLVDASKPGSLMQRIAGIRRQLAQSLGIILPAVRVRDDLQLGANDYVLLLRGVPIARGDVHPGRFLAIDPGTAAAPIPGIKTKEPAFGLEAVWIEESERDRAEAVGYTTVDPSTVIATHLGEALRRQSSQLLGRQEVQELLAALGKHAPKLVEDLVPKQVTHGDLLRVLRALLDEQVPIRDLRTILETLADLLPDTKGTEVLADAVRQRLGAALTHRLTEGGRELHAFFLEPQLEQLLRGAFSGGRDAARLDGDTLRVIVGRFEEAALRSAEGGHSPVAIVAPDLRRNVRDLVSRFVPNLAVLSHREVDGQIEVRSLGRIGIQPMS